MKLLHKVPAAIAVLAVGLGLAACSTAGGGAGAGGSPPANPTGTPKSGGVAYFAEAPSSVPNFIFPYTNFSVCSTTNIAQFQYLLYRPLYSYGNSGSPVVSAEYSLAAPPVYSNGNKTVTIALKPYRWSDGEQVTAQDVVFWLNMEKVEGAGYCGYVPGTLPDDIASVSTPNERTVVLQLKGPVNPQWYTNNELAEITPLPMAWDISAKGQRHGSQACGTASFNAEVVAVTDKGQVGSGSVAASCTAVYDFLETQAGYNPKTAKTFNAQASYASNPIWQVVDGPWRLVTYDSNGYMAFKPNPSYSGPVKARLAEFVELPFTSDTAEYNSLLAGKIDVGYLPAQDITSNAKSPTEPGPNASRLVGRFNLINAPFWQINYFPYNFNSTADNGLAGRIMKQAYFRQAFQELVDQPVIISKVYKGYGYPTYGPVPVYPKNPFASSYETSNPYLYNPAKAKATLSSHGWTINPNGADVCKNGSKCGVPTGTKLNLSLVYASGVTALDQAMAAEISSWRSAGINVTSTQATFDTVIGDAVPCPSKSTPASSCTWDLANWGGGWIFAPDYYPSGEDLFSPGAAANVGSYDSSRAVSLIHSTDYTNTSLNQYENYLTANPPVVWQPVAETAVEIMNKLGGVTPINPLTNINPEDWYFTK
jgi:peptide/nickel transport system substrate-binding protein